VKELSEACREYGLKFGVYLSPWDRNAECYGDSPAYNKFFISQLTELLTNYGQVHEVWFDGACAEGPNGRRQVYDWTAILQTIHNLQPEAVTAIMGDDVRWVGNEGGRGRETEWSATAYTPQSLERGPEQNRALGLMEMSRDLGSRELIAKAQEVSWYPSEVDVSIRPGWFYHPYQDAQVRSLENLVDIYYTSVGRNSVLLLNIPPDTRGLIHEIDAQRLKDLRSYLDETFDENLLARVNRLWKAEEGESREYEVKDGAAFNTLRIREDIAKGQRVESFTLEAFAEGHWMKIAEGTTIGYNRLLKFPAMTAEKIRITISSTRKTARICEVGLFHAPEVKGNAFGEDIPGYADRTEWKSITPGAETAFDGNASTEWKAESLASLSVDMGKMLDFKGFVYTPISRQDLSGTIFKYNFAISSDGTDWQEIITDGEFSNIMHNPVPYEVYFGTSYQARYFRITSLQEINGNNITTVGDFGIIL
jgi:alpha-L-fucosidase